MSLFEPISFHAHTAIPTPQPSFRYPTTDPSLTTSLVVCLGSLFVELRQHSPTSTPDNKCLIDVDSWGTHWTNYYYEIKKTPVPDQHLWIDLTVFSIDHYMSHYLRLDLNSGALNTSNWAVPTWIIFNEHSSRCDYDVSNLINACPHENKIKWLFCCLLTNQTCRCEIKDCLDKL